MQFRTQTQAKQFFVDKIVLQAQKESIPLSDAEKYMLYWTEAEEGFDFDQNLTDRFRAEITEAKFEKKICDLIRLAYRADINRDSGLSNDYENAYRTLAKGDHYVLVMIEKALHNFRLNMKPENGLKDKILLILTAIGIILVPFFTAIVLRLHDHWTDFMIFCYLFLIIYFGYSHVTFSLKKEPISKRLRIYLFQFVVALILIVLYVAVFKYDFVNIQSHSTRRGSGFDYIVLGPLLGLSIFLLDFWLKRGFVYDGITGCISKLRKKD